MHKRGRTHVMHKRGGGVVTLAALDESGKEMEDQSSESKTFFLSTGSTNRASLFSCCRAPCWAEV